MGILNFVEIAVTIPIVVVTGLTCYTVSISVTKARRIDAERRKKGPAFKMPSKRPMLRDRAMSRLRVRTLTRAHVDKSTAAADSAEGEPKSPMWTLQAVFMLMVGWSFNSHCRITICVRNL